MRLAILGDAQGNAFALSAVLDDICAVVPDLILNLGDTVRGFGVSLGIAAGTCPAQSAWQYG